MGAGGAETLDATVRRVDEDRWMATRFADAAARARLVALYAANFEIARTAETVTEPALGDMRLAWWRETIEAMHTEGAALPTHPAAFALSAAVKEANLPLAPFLELIDARGLDLEPQPFEGWPELDAYVDATAGVICALAARAALLGFDPNAEQTLALKSAGRVWGYVGLVRAFRYWAGRGRSIFPKKLLTHLNTDVGAVLGGGAGHLQQAALRAVLDRASGPMADVRRLARRLPPQAFPAVSYVSLAPLYVKNLTRNGYTTDAGVRGPGPLRRQIALVGATARGSL